ncbi:methyl-accepting chemotaxis protein [Ralstonia sp. 25C]|uniref:methyl-accepting chemotaxis protein n=1 Tax=Ralstonia sp. 25C TaxID=3447363 RepID=UPI003F7547D5
MRGIVDSVRFKMLCAFGIGALLLGATGAFGIVGMVHLNSNVVDVYSNNLIPISQLARVQAAQLDVRLQQRRIQAFRDDHAKVESAIKLIRGDLQEINDAWKAYFPDGISSEKEREVATRFNEALPRFNAAITRTVEAVQSGNLDAAIQTLNDNAEMYQAMGAWLVQDIRINEAQAKDFVSDSEATYRRTLRLAIALVGLGCIITAAMSWYLVGAISRPLKVAVVVADRISGGRLDNPIAIDAKGEFGALLTALRKMDQQLAHTVRGIKSSADSVTVASREIAAGNVDLSSRTEQQAASLEETASSMTQLTQTVKQNADNAAQANALAVSASETAQTGNDAVQNLVVTIDKISTSSGKISEITGLIESIAFQTNILALNAAVEAARAGEQGRGFAVVASEVRTLAQRSASAAKEIKELIGASVAVVKEGSAQASEVGATMGQVKDAIRRVSDIVAEIAAASEEQSRGIEQVGQAVTQLDEVTQQNAALVEQAAAAASSLEDQAMKLKDAVSTFELDAGNASAPSSVSAARSTRVRTVRPVTGALKSARKPLNSAIVGVVGQPKDAAASRDQQWGTF